MSQIYYKVVTAESGKLWSAFIRDGMVQYLVNRFVTAPLGGLLVFKSLERAKGWAWGDMEIWKCECEEEVELPSFRGSASREHQRPLDEYWSGFTPLSGYLSGYECGWPPGTLAFKRVKLLKKVEE